MCGIIACLSKNCIEYLLNGLEQLQNRGYDSAGITTIYKNKFITTKYASENGKNALKKLHKEKNKHINHCCGIAHTRWATHGSKTDINSHPHISSNSNFALVHNGIIENYKILKKELEEKNIYSISETDSEIIVNLIEFYYNLLENVERAIEKTLERLEGTWALVILCKRDPNILYCTRKGSPILISIQNNYALIASEQSAFCNKTNNYIVLNNNDICKVYVEKGEIKITSKGKYNLIKIKNKNITLSPHPYKYWTEKEIYEQIDSSRRTIGLGGRLLSNSEVKLGGLEDHKNSLKNIDNIILLGCGTSYYAGMSGLIYIKELCNFNTVQLIDGADFQLYDIPKIGQTALILLSQSGETKDLYRCLEMVKNNDIITIGIVNVVDSLIAREVDCGCYLNAGREVGVASTKSFVSQIILLSMIAIWFAQIKKISLNQRNKYIKDLRNLSRDIQSILETNNIDKFLPLFGNNCFILGKGKGEAIAKEGALKIKELSYIHAEGYSTSSLKHGPFALLEPNFLVILIAPINKHFSKNMNAYEEMKSRHATIILITDNTELNAPNTIQIPTNNTYNDLLCMIPLQLISFKLSLLREREIDFPRNLAKVVTVE